MPLTAMRKCEPLLERLVRSLSPRRIIAETARADKATYYRNFKGYRVEKFGRPRLFKISQKELYERENEFWAQLLIVLWNDTHRKLYSAMRDQVATINEDVEEVELIEDELAHKWLDELLEDWALEDVLLCVHLNDVRFTDAFIRERLEKPLDIDRPVEASDAAVSEETQADTSAPEETDKSAEENTDAA